MFWRGRVTSANCLDLGRNFPLRVLYFFWNTSYYQRHRWSILLDYLCSNFGILSVKYNSKKSWQEKQSTSWNTMSSSASKPLMRLETCINIFLSKVHGIKSSVKIHISQILPSQTVWEYFQLVLDILLICLFTEILMLLNLNVFQKVLKKIN